MHEIIKLLINFDFYHILIRIKKGRCYSILIIILIIHYINLLEK
jgi:hypothetical protein